MGAFSRSSGRSRVLAAVLAAAAVALSLPRSSPCSSLLEQTTVEGGGAIRTARKLQALRAVLRFYAEYAGSQVSGKQYDVNAIGEAWGGAAMKHWVDRPSAAAMAENLEDELSTIRIGGKAASHPARAAMRERRLARQQELDSRPPRHENAMTHWANPANTEDPSQLESELSAMTIGGKRIDDEPRNQMQSLRMARQSA